jgi:hypothetical protein
LPPLAGGGKDEMSDKEKPTMPESLAKLEGMNLSDNYKDKVIYTRTLEYLAPELLSVALAAWAWARATPRADPRTITDNLERAVTALELVAEKVLT